MRIKAFVSIGARTVVANSRPHKIQDANFDPLSISIVTDHRLNDPDRAIDPVCVCVCPDNDV